MTYIEYLNDFNQWLETNALPASSQLMYYKLLYVFNRAGWPEDVGVDNLRLRQMIGNTAEKTAIQARDNLVAAGFIKYQKGRKGSPNRYFLTDKHCKNNSISDSEKVSIFDSEKVSISDSINASHIKTKKKTKTKNITPLTPQLEELGFGKELTAAFADWLRYRKELRKPLTQTGIQKLVENIRKYAPQYGEAAVAGLFERSMSCGWHGVFFEQLEKQPVSKGPSASVGDVDWMQGIIGQRERGDGDETQA